MTAENKLVDMNMTAEDKLVHMNMTTENKQLFNEIIVGDKIIITTEKQMKAYRKYVQEVQDIIRS
jgi:hypothetical protein